MQNTPYGGSNELLRALFNSGRKHGEQVPIIALHADSSGGRNGRGGGDLCQITRMQLIRFLAACDPICQPLQVWPICLRHVS